MFTRRHYNAIAKILAEALEDDEIATQAHAYLTFQFSSLFEAGNPNFKPDFFFPALLNFYVLQGIHNPV